MEDGGGQLPRTKQKPPAPPLGPTSQQTKFDEFFASTMATDEPTPGSILLFTVSHFDCFSKMLNQNSI